MDPVQSIQSTDGGKTFTVPESRIGSAADARSIIATMQRAEITRSQRRAVINGQLNGNRPWSKLPEGQAQRTNWNQREAEGFVAQAKTPYYDLVFEVERYAQFKLRYSGADSSLLVDWSETIGEHYHYTLDDWDAMDDAFQRSQYQMIVHGQGPMIWENAKDWRSESCMAGELLVPDNASADVEKWDKCARPRSYAPSELWKIIQNEESGATGWQIEDTKKAIMNAAPEPTQKAFGLHWETYEAEIRKGSASWDNKSKRIQCLVLYQKEFSGKVSQFILLDSGVNVDTAPAAPPTSQPKPEEQNIGFLFRKIGRFDCFTQIINRFLYDVGPDGDWHSVKGAGPKISDFCKISDRLTCSMIDGAMASTGLILKPTSTDALQETALTHITSGVVVHPKYDVQQNRIGADLQSPLLVKRELRMTMDGNTGQYRRRVPNETPYPTLGQEQLDVSQQAMLSKGDVNRYYRSLDRWHRETFRRLLEMGKKLYAKYKDLAPDSDQEERQLTPSEDAALDFYRSCIEDGVPEEVLKFENFCRIKATRSVGYGSAQMRLMIGDKLVTLLPTMNERARNTALRMTASALGGQPLADMLYPRYDTPQIVDSHMSLAQLENNFLRMPGGKVMVDPSQDNLVHFDSHAADVAQHAQEVQQGKSDPTSLYVHLEQAGPHMHEHLFDLQGDPTRKDQVEQRMKIWLGMSKMADQLKQQLEAAAAAQQANQPQQQPDPELIAALAKVDGELEIKRQKAMGDLQLKAEKQRAQMRMKDVTTAHDMRLANWRAVSETPAA